MKKWLIVALVLSVIGYAFWPSADIVNINTDSEAKAVKEEESPTGIPVRGLVVAAKQQTIVAKQIGTVDRVLVTEGSTVDYGESLIVSTNPVLEAKYAMTSLGGSLRTAASNRGAVEGDLAADLSSSMSREASSTLFLTNNSSTEREEEAMANLKNTNELALIVIPTALRFLQDNTSSLTVSSKEKYDDALKKLYGYAPNYFLNNRISVPGKGQNVYEMIEMATTTGDMLLAASSLSGALNDLNTVFESSASEFYDSDEITTDDPRFSGYASTRQKLNELSSRVDASIANLNQVRDTKKQNLVTTTEAANRASLTELGRQDIASLLRNEVTIASALQSAETDVVAAEIGLGTVRAPYRGIISTVLVEEGSYLQPGTPLFTIIGDGARELEVILPAELLPLLKPGQIFKNHLGKELGFVDRFTPRSTGDLLVVISVTDDRVKVGEVLSGEIEVDFKSLPPDSNLMLLSRLALLFTPQGPTINTVSKDEYKVDIILDLGDKLLVKTEEPLDESLEVKTGIVF